MLAASAQKNGLKENGCAKHMLQITLSGKCTEGAGGPNQLRRSVPRCAHPRAGIPPRGGAGAAVCFWGGGVGGSIGLGYLPPSLRAVPPYGGTDYPPPRRSELLRAALSAVTQRRGDGSAHGRGGRRRTFTADFRERCEFRTVSPEQSIKAAQQEAKSALERRGD